MSQLDSVGAPSRAVRTVLVADLVESVRLIEEDEEGAVQRWRALVDAIAKRILPTHGGRLVKSLGDGLMVEFAGAAAAVQAAFDIQEEARRANADLPAACQMLLRIGVHAGELIAGEHDVYGRSVNLAARLVSLAGPGEIVVSAEVHDRLTPALDAEVEDLGKCHLKHVQAPVRAYRVGPPGAWPVVAPGSAVLPELRPTVAVIPFAAQACEPQHHALGEVIADEVIAALSRVHELNVVSRLSTTAFRDRNAATADIARLLGAHYVLSGSYRVADSRLVLVAEIAETTSGRVLAARSWHGDLRGILSGEDALIDQLAAETCATVVAREIDRAQTRALPTLDSYTLLIGAIALMHRLSAESFARAREMLQAVIERAPRQAVPHAWLAKWHVLRVQQGWSADTQAEGRLALDRTKRALEADPTCSLALAIDGFVHTNLLKQLDVAEDRYRLALRANPNDSLAWLLKGTLHAFRGEGAAAVSGTEQALRLSPLDPLKYFYDSLAATAALSAGRYARAIELARQSLRANRTHTSTLRALAIAQVELRQMDDARATVAELMRLEPQLTVRRYVERSPASAFATGQAWSAALRAAGVPE